MDCPRLSARWWRDPELLVAEVQRHGNRSAAARAHAKETGSTPRLLATAWQQLGLPRLPDGRPPANRDGIARAGRSYKPGLTISDDLATLVTEPTPYDLGDIETLLADRGLKTEDWLIERATVNEWDANAGRDPDSGEPVTIKLRQLKVHLKRKPELDWLFPAVEVAKRYVPKPSRVSKKQDRLAVVCGDQQAPYADPLMHKAFLRWLTDVKPALGALTGDTMDNPTISRHPDRPRWNASPQECIDSAYRLLSDYRDASPQTAWKKLRGNHDYRLESELLNRAERMFALKPAEIPGRVGIPAYSLRNLLHLDALGIELVGFEGDKWEVAEMTLAPGVVVSHKLPTKEKATRMGRTILAGDSHRQNIRRVTFWDEREDGDHPRTETLVEVGCMCLIEEGLGYVKHPDWQAGFATVAIAADGSTSVDLAKWDGRHLMWRGQRW